MNKPKDINYQDLFEFAFKHKYFSIELTDFYIIENVFRKKWNASSGELIGDGEFKNFVYMKLKQH